MGRSRRPQQTETPSTSPQSRSLDDAEWVRGVVRLYERRLLSYAAHMLGDVERGRDVVQETFVRLCGQDRAAVEPRLAEWLFTVCRNLSIDVRRKERRMDHLPEGHGDLQSSNDPLPDSRLEQQEVMAGVTALLQTLSANQQEVIRLKFQQGLSYKEIAAVTDLTVTNVGFLIHTGLKNIRQRLSKSLGDPIRASQHG